MIDCLKNMTESCNIFTTCLHRKMLPESEAVVKWGGEEL